MSSQFAVEMIRGIGSLLFVLTGCASSSGNGGGGSEVAQDFANSRTRMVADQILARGVEDRAVLDAMGSVPRHEFVPVGARNLAYADHPLSIGHDQTISQPYIVAFMTEALGIDSGQKVLEIGTGSGYQAAVLATMGVDVYSIEIVEPLGLGAREVLARLGHKVNLRIGDGYEGWPEAAPFDGILVTAAPKKVPAPLEAQLKEGGRMVIPVGGFFQDLKVYEKRQGKLTVVKTLPVRFVPMTGKAE